MDDVWPDLRSQQQVPTLVCVEFKRGVLRETITKECGYEFVLRLHHLTSDIVFPFTLSTDPRSWPTLGFERNIEICSLYWRLWYLLSRTELVWFFVYYITIVECKHVLKCFKNASRVKENHRWETSLVTRRVNSVFLWRSGTKCVLDLTRKNFSCFD